MEEMRAEGAAAALEAACDLEPRLNVPLDAYLRMRVPGSAIARHRREWAIALRPSPRGSRRRPRVAGRARGAPRIGGGAGTSFRARAPLRPSALLGAPN